MGYDNMAKLPNMVSGLKVTAEELKKAGESSCEPCIMSKQHKHQGAAQARISTNHCTISLSMCLFLLI
jgi:hypothetical protein